MYSGGRYTPVGSGRPPNAGCAEQTQPVLWISAIRLWYEADDYEAAWTVVMKTGVVTALHKGVIKGDNPNTFRFIDDAWGSSNTGWGKGGVQCWGGGRVAWSGMSAVL